MTGPRTITVDTGDRGAITLTDPAWCTLGHRAESHAAAIHHVSDPVVITIGSENGPVQILQLALWQDPFLNPAVDSPHGTDVHISLYIGGDLVDSVGYPLADLDALSADLMEAAQAVRLAARDLLALANGGPR